MSEKIHRYAGFGTEATFGTPVSAVWHRDITAATLDTPDDPLLHYEGGLGRSRRITRPGYYSPEGSIEFGLDIPAAIQLMQWALGQSQGNAWPNVEITGAATSAVNGWYTFTSQTEAAITWTKGDNTVVYSRWVGGWAIAISATDQYTSASFGPQIGDAVWVATADATPGDVPTALFGKVIKITDSGNAAAVGTYRQIAPAAANALTVVESLGWTWAFATEDNLRIYGYNGGDGGVSIWVNDGGWSSVYIADYEDVDPGVIINPTWTSGTQPYPTMAWFHPAISEAYGAVGTILPSFTARVGKDEYEHVFAGCIINSLDITIDSEFIGAAVEIQARSDAKATITAVGSLKLTEDMPLAFHEMVLTAGYDPCKVRSLTISVNNNLDVDAGRGAGSRFPCRIPAGMREVSLSAELWYDDADELERFWGGENAPSDAGPTEFAVSFYLKAIDGQVLELSLPRCIYTGVSHQPSGRERIDEAVEVMALLGNASLQASEVESEITVTHRLEVVA